MAWEIPGFSFTLPAAADYSAAGNQFKFVKNVAGQATICTGATDKPIGVLQNTPKAGQEAQIMVTGISKVQGDANLAVDDLIGTSADGQADAKIPGTDTTEYVVGRVIEDNSAAGGLATCLINCANPHRAA
jgi:hypothetical protein